MFTVVLDACVLVPITLADTLLRIAQAGGFAVRWSDEILDEVERSIVRLGASDAAARRRVGAMAAAFPFARVTDYENLIPALGNDPKDRHVLAAALKAQCDTIVTFNLKDFPPEAMAGWEVEAVNPDQFLLGQLDLVPGIVMSALANQSAAYAAPPRTVRDIVGTLARTGPAGLRRRGAPPPAVTRETTAQAQRNA